MRETLLVGEEDWNANQETLHLLSVPGMRESITEGLATAAGQCEKNEAGVTLAGRLFEAGPEGCPPAQLGRSPVEGRAATQHPRRRSVPESRHRSRNSSGTCARFGR